MDFASSVQANDGLNRKSADRKLRDLVAKLTAKLARPKPANDNIEVQTDPDKPGSPYGASKPNMWWVP